MTNLYTLTITEDCSHITTLDFDSMGGVTRHLIDNESSMIGQQVHIHQIPTGGLPRLIGTFTVGAPL